MGRITLAVNARLTQGADWLQPRLPSLLGRVFKGLRVINPITFGAFAFQKIKTDPVFFATYGVFTFAFSNALIPGLMALGVGPVAATILRFATGTPLDIAAITLRTHARRTDRSQRLGDTARALLRDYSDFARERRHRYREHAKSLGRAGGLKRMGAAL